MGTLYLIRHGQASYGEADYDRLSARGHEQARAVGHWLAKARLDAVYAGPLRRQQQTITTATEQAIALGAAVPAVQTLPELAEYPAFEMLQHLVPRLVAEDPKFAALTSAPTPRLLDDAFHTILRRWSADEWHVDGVERVGVFVARVRSGLDRVLRAAGSGARLACVTSAGPIGVAVGLTFGIPDERMVRTSIVIRNASITELRFRSEQFDWQPDQLSLVTFNLTAHLPEGLDTAR
ncbi:MAG: histidine phosphatase family protein [Deltaproteobacteria bacterium]|nr:histidine phosphatase family protein [Deltaproteobacteria bacterium]